MTGVSGVFQVVALAAGAWVAAYALEQRGRKGYGLVTGSELLLVGLALGPVGLDVISSELLNQARPVIGLCGGWLGLRFGLRLRPGAVAGLPLRMRMLGILEGSVSCLGLRGLLWAADRLLHLGLDPTLCWGLAALGAATTKSGVAWARSRHGACGELVDVLEAIVRSDDLVAIGVIAAAVAWASGSPLLNLGATLAAGLMSGALGVLVLGWTHSRPEAGWIAALGTCSLADGLATQLGLAPMAVTALCGAALTLAPKANLEEITRDTERPVVQLLLILAGAWVDPMAWVGLMVALPLLRFAAKMVGGLISAGWARWSGPRVPYLGLGLFSAGGVALGLAFTYAFTLPVRQGQMVISAMAAVILVGDLLGSPILKALLSRQGQLPVAESPALVPAGHAG